MAFEHYGELKGNLDRCENGTISGWALDAAYPDRPVHLEIAVDGVVIARTYAGLFRQDLEEAEIGQGHHAFEIWLHALKRPAYRIEVRRVADRRVLATHVAN